MPAQHKNAVYRPIEDAPNPFREGQDKAYADILADKIKEVNLWRKSALASALLFAAALILFLVSISQQKTVPVLINVMPSGESQYIGEVRQSGATQVPDAAVLYEIREFVSNLRSVSTDYQVVYSNIDRCFVFSHPSYSPVLRQFILGDSPFDLVGKIRRAVEVESVLHITDRSYQINWTETVFESASSPKNLKMRAVVSVRLLTPTDATIKRNPLGIYIENFEMTELQ